MLSTDREAQLVIETILGKTWEELAAVEWHDEMLFPEELKRRKSDGTFERVPIMLKVLREPDVRKARLAARAIAKAEGLNPELDPELFDNLDAICVLHFAIRSATPPYEPLAISPQELERYYDRPSLDAAYAKIDAYRHVLDPRPDVELTAEQTAGIIAAVAKARNIVPLAALAGRSQNNFVVSMAVQLVSSQTEKLLSAS